MNEHWKSPCGRVELYCGDCLKILPTLAAGRVDAVVTDPPYGIGFVHSGCGGWCKDGKQRKTKFGPTHALVGDDKPFDPTPFLKIGRKHIFWGGNHYAQRLPQGRWIIWDKRCGSTHNNQSDCEIAWCDSMGSDRIIYHLWNGFARASESGIPRIHPTQKPIEVMLESMKWARIKDCKTVLDPFAGSFTTGVAAIKLGLRFVGIEIDQRYFDDGKSRIIRAIEEKASELPLSFPEEHTQADLFTTQG